MQTLSIGNYTNTHNSIRHSSIVALIKQIASIPINAPEENSKLISASKCILLAISTSRLQVYIYNNTIINFIMSLYSMQRDQVDV